MMISLFLFFKQKTAYEMRISDWSSDVCSSDLQAVQHLRGQPAAQIFGIVHARGDDGELQAHGEVEHRNDVVVDHGSRPEQILLRGGLARSTAGEDRKSVV